MDRHIGEDHELGHYPLVHFEKKRIYNFVLYLVTYESGLIFPFKFEIWCFIWNFEGSQGWFEILNDFREDDFIRILPKGR